MQIQTISSIVLFVLLLSMLYMILTNKALRSRLRSSEKVPPLFYTPYRDKCTKIC